MARRPKTDPLWAELVKLEGIPPTAAGVHAARLVADHQPARAYAHPQHVRDMPQVNAMLNDLADRGTADQCDLALKLDTDLYNAWARHHCEQSDLVYPGDLSPSQFKDRYWSNGQDEPDAVVHRSIEKCASTAIVTLTPADLALAIERLRCLADLQPSVAAFLARVIDNVARERVSAKGAQ